MVVIRIVRVCALAGLSWLLCGVLSAENCANLPTSFTGSEFPNGDFFSNFDNSCYTIHMGTGAGSVEYGDLNATYYQMFFKVDPRYQVILLGNFPNARYFSVALNDDHTVVAQSILDSNIVPLTAQYINPYLPGTAYVPGQQYAVPINFGGTPGQQETGCMMNGYNVNVNALDGTQRHSGMDWNSDAGFFSAYRTMWAHDVDNAQHTNPNTAGLIMVRAYINASPNQYAFEPHIIVRDVASGCAYPADYALNTLQIVAPSNSVGLAWMNSNQSTGHHIYEMDYLPKLCDSAPPSGATLHWAREPDYIPITNPYAGYVVAAVPPGVPATLKSAGEVMRIRLRVPTTPATPCTNGCSLSGDEQMRYMSLSFESEGGSTMASIADNQFTKDPNGYATLIVGTGAAVPSWITAANGYTYLNLTALPNYQQLSLLALRNIIASGTFSCAAQYVPYRNGVDTPTGSLLGDYTPVVDYPKAATLPRQATPLTQLSACQTFPLGDPGTRPKCGVFPSPTPSITSVVTQCAAPGCTQFAAQSNPPITIVGQGFGTFPSGFPFTGTSNYLGIKDVTQHWNAGYTGGTCNVTIVSWDSGRIQLVADLPNSKGYCKLVSGDKVGIEVWNPQSMVSTTYQVTAQ